MSFLAVQSQASIEKFYEIGGRLLAFQFSDEVAARVAREFIEGMYFTPIDAPATRAARFVHCTVNIFQGDPPPLPPGCQTFEVPRGLCHTKGDEHFLDIDESRIAVSTATSRLVSVWLGATAHARHPVAIVNTLSYAVQAALRRGGLYVLHAAGVVEPVTGTGMIVVGNSNSGKSSLTIRLAGAGWRYLSDDMLVLAEENGMAEAWALRRIFSVSSSSLANSGLTALGDALGAPVNSDPSKRKLEPRISFPGSFVESCRPRVLLFPTLTGEASSRIEKLSSGEAMAQLIRQCPWASYDASTAREHLRVLGLMAKQSISYKLYAGLDLLEDSTRAPQLLASCLEQ
ncbi:MAG TPA: hypothetical protein VD835_18265 [Pyrinomonadaceae bacterium]|nr:hypothetical protein [Pyrinomonadaceae bacterium]